MRTSSFVGLASLCLAAACTHSDAFTNPVSALGPSSAGPDVQLTYNPDQDYWPIWTQDGKGILYAYVDQNDVKHRCIGLLPASGGTRVWSLCDDRVIRADTASSYAAFALDSTGRLLVAEAVSPGSGTTLTHEPAVTLWTADTASPYARTNLLSLPTTVDGNTISWLSDVAWTGPASFIALGSKFGTVTHCVIAAVALDSAVECRGVDSVFVDSQDVVVQGTVSAGKATLHAVAGTSGATGYTLAEGGASVVFSAWQDTQLYRVPITGGTREPLLSTAGAGMAQIAGVSCRGETCVYARDSVSFTPANPPDSRFNTIFWYDSMKPWPYPLDSLTPIGSMELHRVSLATGTDQLLLENRVPVFYATPILGPNGDVVLQEGGGWGHLQTFATAAKGDLFATDGNSVLHLLRGAAP